MSGLPHPESTPSHRVAPARAVAEAVSAARRIVLTTHVNADGDGIGSEVALIHLLRGQRKQIAVANPTAIPERYTFLLDGIETHDRTTDAVAALREADLLLVLDISDLGRLGHLAETIRSLGIATACVDHHLSPGALPAGPRLVDAGASATGELIYDLAVVADWPVGIEVARSLYVAMLTDTGGFRFGNTTPAILRRAASLLEVGIHPERVYEQVYATAPVGRIRLTAEVLDTLEVEPELGLSWVSVPEGALERHDVTPDDLDGLVEFARSVQGTRVAMLFRRLANHRVKVSFRSVGDFDVATFAQQFGGGGHAKASGASIAGDMDDVRARVLDAARAALARPRASD